MSTKRRGFFALKQDTNYHKKKNSVKHIIRSIFASLDS